MDKKKDNLKDLRSENPKLFSRLMQERDAASRYDVYEKIDSDKAWQRFRDRHFSGKPPSYQDFFIWKCTHSSTDL